MDTASVTGRVAGPLGKGVQGAWIELVDTDRNTRLKTLTNDAGLYIFPSVRPGHYRMQVSALGYKTVELKSLSIYTRADIQQNFALVRGVPEDSVILASSGTPIQTNGAVSTVVEQQLVNELPLNGRSFQTLFQLVPGVTITPTTFASQGQISVNGQRTDTNDFVVDGVSANFAVAAGVNPGQSAGGWLPALTVFGGTNSLVSTEAVQEFAVLTSSYSAEFGRVPGAQISIVTRSGTNTVRGSLFEYLRNDAFDANDWFANNKGLKRAALRQNDFGGVLGGPIIKNKTFFFASLEALQLRQPTSSSTAVPSLMARNSAPAPVKPFLNAYPLPNGPAEGNGLAQATYGFSNPSSLEALSFRVDHHFRESLDTFVRFAYSTSDSQQRAAGSDASSTVTDTRFGLKTLTGGIAYSISQGILNDFRFNWSRSSADSKEELDSFGGAIPLGQQLVFPPGFNAQTSLFQFSPAFVQQVPELELGQKVENSQTQVNLVDDVS
ncbi:MAG TPA: carboxypeptidase regulatory-like domain-containing protein, partial [Candidatus Angelobacter sp.]